jgi:hypothetical protein
MCEGEFELMKALNSVLPTFAPYLWQGASTVKPRYNELKETGGSIRYIGVFIISDVCIYYIDFYKKLIKNV